MRKNNLNPTEVQRLIRYDPITGLLYWRERQESDFKRKTGRLSAAQYCDVFNRIQAGNVAGGPAKTGYTTLMIKGRIYLGHRVAWAIMTGKWPKLSIDHADRCRANNKWANLRLCSQSQNIANGPKRKTNTSGHKGVTWDRRAQKKWRATLGVNKKAVYLGIYDNKEDAAEAYIRGAKKYFGEFAREI